MRLGGADIECASNTPKLIPDSQSAVGRPQTQTLKPSRPHPVNPLRFHEHHRRTMHIIHMHLFMTENGFFLGVRKKAIKQDLKQFSEGKK